MTSSARCGADIVPQARPKPYPDIDHTRRKQYADSTDDASAAHNNSSSAPSTSLSVVRLSKPIAVSFNPNKLQEHCDKHAAQKLGLTYPPLGTNMPRFHSNSHAIGKSPSTSNQSRKQTNSLTDTSTKVDYGKEDEEVGTRGTVDISSLRPCSNIELEDGMWNFEREAIISQSRKGIPRAANMKVEDLTTPEKMQVVDEEPPSIIFSPVLRQLRDRLRDLSKEDDMLSCSSQSRRGVAFGADDGSGPFGFGSRSSSAQLIISKGSPTSLSQQRRASRRSRVLEENPNFVSARASIEQELGGITMESETNLPIKDLHIYMQYCAMTKMTIILRPISVSVPDLYAGTSMLDAKHTYPDGTPRIATDEDDYQDIMRYTSFECRVKGKSIHVTLKSSPYPPICGCIPVNPALGKAYIDAQRREREIEDMLLNAASGNISVFVRKLKAQKLHASAMTAAFVRDTDIALNESNIQFTKLMQAYHDEIMNTTEKLAVSRKYINSLNDTQFLGVTQAKWREWEVFYTVDASNNVLRDGKDIPIFYIKKGQEYFMYSDIECDAVKEPKKEDLDSLRPVHIVTHRTFYISKDNFRIEEEAHAYSIGPDFDGLNFAQNYHFNEFGELRPPNAMWGPQDHIQWASEVTDVQYRTGYGVTGPRDIIHIDQMRFLTDWKQNHGYECHNTMKTQNISRGNYVCLTPTNFSILRDMRDIISYCRCAWRDGTPLLLNPSWKVAVDVKDGLPFAFGDELDIPIVDDCGASHFALDLEAYESMHQIRRGDTIQKLSASFLPMAARRAAGFKPKAAKMKVFSNQDDIPTASDLEARFQTMMDKKELVAAFFLVRRWQLLPGRFVMPPPPLEDLMNASSCTFDEKICETLCPVFEAYREEKVKSLNAAFLTCMELFNDFHSDSKGFSEMLETFVSVSTS